MQYPSIFFDSDNNPQFPKKISTLPPFFPQCCCLNAIWVLWIHPTFSVYLSPCAMKDEKGFWGIECIKQLNKGCHKGSDSTARGRGTGMQSPSPFVLRHTAPE